MQKKMREEYIYAIGYRKINSEKESLVLGTSGKFKLLKPTWRYWWADPLLCEGTDGKVSLYMEGYDMLKRKGFIGKSVFKDGRLTRPEKVIEEPFHMSFPMIFIFEGAYYMLPETNRSGNVYIYKLVDGVWTKYYETPLTGIVDVCVKIIDGVIYIFVGRKRKDNGRYIRTEIWKLINVADINKIRFEVINDNITDYSLTERNAGRILRINQNDYRLKQFSSNENYGEGVDIYRVLKFDGESYEETYEKRLTLENVELECSSKDKNLIGIHTYDLCKGYEVIDVAWKKKSIVGACGRVLIWLKPKINIVISSFRR